MAAEVARRVLYATVLLMMIGTFWVAAWSNALSAQVRRGWWPPLKSMPAGVAPTPNPTPLPG